VRIRLRPCLGASSGEAIVSADQIFLALCWFGAVGAILAFGGWLAERIEQRRNGK